jgi:hypothetical protein
LHGLPSITPLKPGGKPGRNGRWTRRQDLYTETEALAAIASL